MLWDDQATLDLAETGMQRWGLRFVGPAVGACLILMDPALEPPPSIVWHRRL